MPKEIKKNVVRKAIRISDELSAIVKFDKEPTETEIENKKIELSGKIDEHKKKQEAVELEEVKINLEKLSKRKTELEEKMK